MLHIAILRKPFLDQVLAGTKRIECRLTKQARAPYNIIKTGETIFLKQSSGPFRAVAQAGKVICESDLTPARIREVQREYASELGIGGDAFWEQKRDCNYLTLIWLEQVNATNLGPDIPPLQGRAWLMLEEVEMPAMAHRESGPPAESKLSR